MTNKIRAPSNLSKKSQTWWRKIVDEYGIADSGGLLILKTLCEALDTALEAQRVLDDQGITIKDRFGAIKSHPLCAVLRDARAQVYMGVKSLNLDIMPLNDRVGRPPGR